MYYDVEIWVRIDEYWTRQFCFAIKETETEKLTSVNWKIESINIKQINLVGYIKRQLLTGISCKKEYFTT